MEAFHSIFLSFLIIGLCDFTAQQRVAPGVPPQQYQHNQQQQYQQPPPPPPPQYQQVPQGQVPFQQGQVPVQQHGHVPMQQQVPQQQVPQQQVHMQQPPPPQGQVPVGHAHGHGHPPHGQPILDASNVANERAHIQEHMDVPIDTSQMSEQELQFHYFKMHDADNNNKLDGCELVKSLIHWHDQSNHDPRGGHPIPEAKVFKDDELSNMIDPILQNDDKNKDGFIDYTEFVQAQASAASRQAAQHAA